MLVNEDYLKKLRAAFDLNIYEAKIWVALLSKGVASAGELSDISDVPRSRSYDVLESLEKRGFIIMKLGKPIKYIAVKPNEVIKRAKSSLQELADTRIKTLGNIEDTELFKELALLYKNGINHIDASAISGSIRGRSNIYGQIQSMLDGAQKSVVLVTSAGGFKRKADHFTNTFKRLSNKGVKVKIAAPVNKELAKSLINIAEIRNADKMNARFMIVDDKELLFMLNNDESVHESYDIGVWIKSPFFVNALGSLFNITWQKLEKV